MTNTTEYKLEIIDLFFTDLAILFEKHKGTEEERAFNIFSTLFKRAVEQNKTQILIKYFSTIVNFLNKYQDDILRNELLSGIPPEERIDYINSQNSLHIGFILKNSDKEARSIIRGHLLAINCAIKDDEESKSAIDQYIEQKKTQTKDVNNLLGGIESLANKIVTPEMESKLKDCGNDLTKIFPLLLNKDTLPAICGELQKIMQGGNLQEATSGLMKMFDNQNQ